MKKALRIKKSDEFQTVLKKRHFVASPSYALYYREAQESHARIGISASKKLGNAVVRNKIKRQVRMMVQEIYTFDEPFDSVIIVRHPYLKKTYQENLDELKSSYKKVRMKCKFEGDSNETNQT